MKIVITEEQYNRLNESITLDIKVGDTLMGGRFKNKTIVVKTIDKNDKGDIVINGKPLLRFRILKESPDTVKIFKKNYHWFGKKEKHLYFNEPDAFCFGFYNGQCYVNRSQTHSELKKRYSSLAVLDNHIGEYVMKYKDYDNLPRNRNEFKFSGRLWNDEKVISFWEYPNKHELLNVLNGISREIEIIYKLNIDFSKYLIEIEKPHREGSELIPIKKYVGSENNDMNIIHNLPPEKKRESPQMVDVLKYKSKNKSDKFEKTPEYLWNYYKTKNLGENKRSN